MEITIGIYAIIIISFFLIIPGYLTRRLYFNGEFSKQININNGTLINLIYSLFLGIVLIVCFVYVFNYFNKDTINIDSVLNSFDNYFVSGQNSSSTEKFNGLTVNIKSIYIPIIGALYIFCGIIGFFSSKLIIFTGLDTKWKFFRFSNNWHYLFSGKILKFKKHTESDIDYTFKVKYTYLDILVSEKGDETTLYSGLYADYEINPRDISKLDKIHLFKAVRYKKNNGTVESKNIPGNIFTIMGDRILNINCTYICFDEEVSKNKSFKIQKNIFIPTLIFSSVFFLIITISFIFSFNLFNSNWYENLLSRSIYEKCLVLFLLNSILGLFTPFKIQEDDKKIEFIGWEVYMLKFLPIIITLLILFFFYDFSLMF